MTQTLSLTCMVWFSVLIHQVVMPGLVPGIHVFPAPEMKHWLDLSAMTVSTLSRKGRGGTARADRSNSRTYSYAGAAMLTPHTVPCPGPGGWRGRRWRRVSAWRGP